MKLTALVVVLCPAFSAGARIHRGGVEPDTDASDGHCTDGSGAELVSTCIVKIPQDDKIDATGCDVLKDFNGMTSLDKNSFCGNVCTNWPYPGCTGWVIAESDGVLRCEMFNATISEGDGASGSTCYKRTAPTPAPTPAPTLAPTPAPTPVPNTASSYGDPHSRNVHGQRFDIKRPGNHSFLVLPRGVEKKKANLNIDAIVTQRGGLCTGQLFITGLKLSGRWVDALGGEIELHAATDMFNSPGVVGLKLGNSRNMSLQEFAARIPKHMLAVSQFHPELPVKMNTHVNTLKMQFHVGQSTIRVGWAHEKLGDGFANWLWLDVSGLGAAENVGGLLGSDNNSAAQQIPEEVLAACKTNRETRKSAPAAGFVEEASVFKSWASAES